MNATSSSTSSPATPACNACCPFVATKHLLSWKNPVLSGGVLAAIDVAFLIFWGFDFSMIRLIALLGLTVMLLGLVVSLMTVRPESRVEFISKAQLESHLVSIYDNVNRIGHDATDLLFWKDRVYSAKAASFLLLLAYLSDWLTFSILAVLGVNFLFLHQHLYDAYQTYASSYVADLSKLVQQYINKIPKLPKGKHD